MPSSRPDLPAHEISSICGSPEASTTLSVAVYPSVDQTVLRALGLWKLIHPETAVRLTSRHNHDHHRALADALANGVGVPDVVCLEATYVSRFAALGGLENLSDDPYRAESFAPGLARYALPAARSATGALLALPADVAPAVLFYRHDLLERAGVGPGDLGTWEGLLGAGRRLRETAGVALVSNVSTLADLRARDGIPAGEGIYFDAGGAPRLRSERFVAAFELAREARAARIDVPLDDDWSPRWEALVGGGHVAAQPCGCWLVGMLESWIAPRSRGLWRTADLPAGVRTAWGGSYYALPRASRHRALAWDFVQLMCLDRRAQLLAFEHAGAFPALNEALEDPFLDEPLPYLGGQRARQEWRRTAAQIPVLPAHPLDSLAAGVLRSALRAVLDHGQGVEQALAEAERHLWRLLKDGV